MKRSLPRRVGTKSVFCFFALVFLASSGGHTDHWDGKVYYLVSESVALNGSLELGRDSPSADMIGFDADSEIAKSYEMQKGRSLCLAGWDFGAGTCNPHELQDDWADPALPDSIYTGAAPLLPVLAAPLYAAERLVGMPGQLAPFLANPLILAATAAVLFRLSDDVFRSRPKAFVLALAFGVCSFAWPYGDTFLLQPIAGLLLLLSVYLAHLGAKRGGLLLPALAGVAAGGVVFAHASSVIFVPGLAAFFVLSARSWKKIAPFMSGLAAAAAVHMWINHARFGDALDFGYGRHAELGAHAYADGLFGLIFSPGFGLLANMPLLVLVPVGVCLLWKKHRALALLVGYAFAVSYAYFGTLESPVWHGFGGWGPRYLVPIIPLMVLPLGFLLDRAAGALAKASFAVLAAAGFLVNLTGVLVWYQLGYTYGWNSMRESGVPLEQQMDLFQWAPQWAPAALHARVLESGYWEAIVPAPGVAYWEACVPDVLLYCSFGPAGAVLALIAVAAAGFWVWAELWAGGPRGALESIRPHLRGRIGRADARASSYDATVLHMPKGLAGSDRPGYDTTVLHLPKTRAGRGQQARFRHRARGAAGALARAPQAGPAASEIERSGKQYLGAVPIPRMDDFYSPVPDPAKIPEEFFDSETQTVDWNDAVQEATLRELARFGPEYEPIEKNDMFGWHDAPVYYCMVRRFRPSRIVEVGGGNSTKVSSAACRDNGRGSITVVDPFMDESFDPALRGVEIIRKPVQEMPLEAFTELRANDVLFIDSTHVSKTYSDVNYLVLEVLPRLRPGVLVHFHDIHLPRPYPLEWMTKYELYFNEQYILQAFLYGNRSFEIIAALKYLGNARPDLLRAVHGSEPPGGGSFWIRSLGRDAAQRQRAVV